MFVNFETLNKYSKVWIYQSSREFSDEEVETIKNRLLYFVNSWKRHGDDLKASFQIKYNQFIVIAVDESFNNVSGCSIDASVHIMKQIENEFDVSLFDKMNIAYKDYQSVKVVKMSDFKSFILQQKIDKNTIVFNNLVNSLEEFNNNWELPVEKSWQSKYLD